MTRIPSFAFYLLFLCALLGAPVPSLIVVALVYAAVRGLAAAPGGLVSSPRDLRRLTTVIARFEPLASKAGRRASDVAAAGCVVAVLLVAAL